MWEELFKYCLLTKQRTIVISEIAITIVVVIAEIAIAVIEY